MAFLQQMRSPRLSFIQTLLSLFLATLALLSSNWCVGKQKVPKPLCTPTKHSNCIPVPGVSNSSNIQFSWETGDDRFVFPVFHTGLFITCEENIYSDQWGLYHKDDWRALAEFTEAGALMVAKTGGHKVGHSK
uniref:Uncharacterized protein n=1 Tax=Knipowitschia caucasica TaxID=637954 RepID=A0AAV2KMP6_KNICA